MSSKVKSFRADEALLDRLHAESESRGISQNQLIVAALEEFLNKGMSKENFSGLMEGLQQAISLKPDTPAPAGKFITHDGNTIPLSETLSPIDMIRWGRAK